MDFCFHTLVIDLMYQQDDHLNMYLGFSLDMYSIKKTFFPQAARIESNKRKMESEDEDDQPLSARKKPKKEKKEKKGKKRQMSDSEEEDDYKEKQKKKKAAVKKSKSAPSTPDATSPKKKKKKEEEEQEVWKWFVFGSFYSWFLVHVSNLPPLLKHVMQPYDMKSITTWLSEPTSQHIIAFITSFISFECNVIVNSK